MYSVKHLPGEVKCRRLVEEIILGKEPCCPICKRTLNRSKDYYWCKYCRKKIRAKSLTWFRSSKLEFLDILILIWCWQKNIHPGAIRNLYGLSYTTASRWYSRFRQHLPRDKDILKGIVETDEAYFGKRRFNNQTIVMGGLERKSNKLKLAAIPDREQDSLEIFLDKYIHKDSLLHTDAWTGYYDLSWCGYGHEIHNHSLGHFKHTNKIENVWSVTKRQIRKMYGQIRTNKLPEFLTEWEARWNFPELFKSPFTYLETCLVPY